ncbi:hypothetical protein ACHQM5_031083 [Ranunculus cassubicifolius]
MSSPRLSPSKRDLDPKRGAVPLKLNRVFFPLILPSPFPWLWFRWIVDRDSGNLVNPFMRHPQGPSQCFVLIKQSDSLVRTSSESTVRRPGKATEATVPNPSPDRHAATRSRPPEAARAYDRARLVLGPPDFQGSPGAHRTPRDICTNGGSTRARALGFAATAAPSYSSGPNNCPDGRVWVARFSAIHFRG